MPLARRYVDHTSDLTGRCDSVDFSVIWFYCIKVTANNHHAVPGTIGLEVCRFWIGNGIGMLKCNQVCNQGMCSIGVNPDDAVWEACNAVRATSPGKQRVQLITYKGD